MKEVKFRIYDKQEKKFLIKNQKIKNGDIKSILNEIIDLEECSVQINNPEENRYEFLQSTGIKDMNGKEIYDGDILSNDERYYTVSFYNGSFRAEYADGFEDYSLDLVDIAHCSIVIGNVFENPELLGV